MSAHRLRNAIVPALLIVGLLTPPQARASAGGEVLSRLSLLLEERSIRVVLNSTTEGQALVKNLLGAEKAGTWQSKDLVTAIEGLESHQAEEELFRRFLLLRDQLGRGGSVEYLEQGARSLLTMKYVYPKRSTFARVRDAFRKSAQPVAKGVIFGESSDILPSQSAMEWIERNTEKGSWVALALEETAAGQELIHAISSGGAPYRAAPGTWQGALQVLKQSGNEGLVIEIQQRLQAVKASLVLSYPVGGSADEAFLESVHQTASRFLKLDPNASGLLKFARVAKLPRGLHASPWSLTY